mmetsp:Transcript_21838/g.74213  ORF Transcript_21838/g.74213 Transcript_21838/m.74213 type:complete len:235 (+) Transcript_21838:208-912(+)
MVSGSVSSPTSGTHSSSASLQTASLKSTKVRLLARSECFTSSTTCIRLHRYTRLASRRPHWCVALTFCHTFMSSSDRPVSSVCSRSAHSSRSYHCRSPTVLRRFLAACRSYSRRNSSLSSCKRRSTASLYMRPRRKSLVSVIASSGRFGSTLVSMSMLYACAASSVRSPLPYLAMHVLSRISSHSNRVSSVSELYLLSSVRSFIFSSKLTPTNIWSRCACLQNLDSGSGTSQSL